MRDRPGGLGRTGARAAGERLSARLCCRSRDGGRHFRLTEPQLTLGYPNFGQSIDVSCTADHAVCHRSVARGRRGGLPGFLGECGTSAGGAGQGPVTGTRRRCAAPRGDRAAPRRRDPRATARPGPAGLLGPLGRPACPARLPPGLPCLYWLPAQPARLACCPACSARPLGPLSLPAWPARLPACSACSACPPARPARPACPPARPARLPGLLGCPPARSVRLACLTACWAI